MSEGGVRSGVGATRGWGLVFVCGPVLGLLATFDVLDGWLWRVAVSAVVFVWRLPWVAPVVVACAVVAMVVAAVRVWRGWDW